MSNPVDNFKINLNQNLWGLLISFGFLGAAEHYDLGVLFCFSVISSLVMVISIIFTTYAYTKNYVNKKNST